MGRWLKRIRLVSRHYHELQGVRLAFVGSIFVLVFGTYVSAQPPQGVFGVWIALAFAFVLIAPGDRALRRYYASAFGRVASPQQSWIVLVVVYGAGFVLAGLLLDLEPPAASYGAIACYVTWVVIRDWPLRIYFVLILASAVLGGYLVKSAPSEAGDAAVASAFVLIGAASVLVGLLDHRLLASTMMHRRKRESESRAPSSPAP